MLPGGRASPLWAHSVGTGQLVRAALDAGARTVVLGVGGSAGTDGGAGLLVGLGARLLDATGAELAPGGGQLRRLERVELSGLDPRLSATTLVLASDVDNPLLGPRGAAEVYGPVVLELTGLAARLAGASLVITGEGSLDAQTLHGKAPLGVAAEAARADLPGFRGRPAWATHGVGIVGTASAHVSRLRPRALPSRTCPSSNSSSTAPTW